MSASIDPRLVSVAIEEIPALVGWIRGAFAKANPNAPQPTSDEIVAAFNTACVASLGVDSEWLRSHPEPPA